MLTRIQSQNDVESFARQLVNEGVSFHPDSDFREYVNTNTNEPTYTPEEADKRNQLLEECFEVCTRLDKNIYGVMLNATLEENGLNQLIPSH